jgi:hypothetical protein
MPDIDPRVLLFGTCYVDSEARVKLTVQWAELMLRLNADCDIWLIDSQSPLMPRLDPRIRIFSFPDNIGHLSRRNVTPGKDGWGRAFCKGLQLAIDGRFDFVAHIEADSLFRLSVLPICLRMRRDKIMAASIPVLSGARVIPQWVETGLMFFDVEFLRRSNFVSRYDWPNRRSRPTPEVVINRMLGPHLTMMPWRGMRQDKLPTISRHNIAEAGFDWITHFHNDGAAYDKFLETVGG